MNAPQTIARSIVIDALHTLGLTTTEMAGTTIVHIAGDHISLERLTGEGVYWRRITDECASCHAPEGREHTEYCKRPDPWTAPLAGIEVRPRRDAVDQADDAAQTKLDAVAGPEVQILEPGSIVEPEPWVDNGCRCPNPEHHRPGCIAATTAPLEGDFGHHLREDCPDRGCCILHAIT